MTTKSKFAKLISVITHLADRELSVNEIDGIDSIVADETPFRADPGAVNELLSAMLLGKKIEAIKAYRALTGESLVNAKNVVEGYWPSTMVAS